MQHQPSKSTQDVNREWTPEERARISAQTRRIDADPLLSVLQKLKAIMALIDGDGQ